jgi:gamma-glutamyltranspeptidase/glutathione hydrolase
MTPRSCTAARNVVATSQTLASQAGVFVLREGGNAVDAAIATAACLTVVEPCSNGLGSDAFAIVWDGSDLHGFNGSGRSPAALTPERVGVEMPQRGWLPVTVPGAVDAWHQLHARLGRLPFDRVLVPAIEYAERGFPVSPRVSQAWRSSVERFRGFEGWMRTFAPDGNGPDVGQIVRLPDHARTLRAIAPDRGESFYRGEIAQRIDAHARATDGLLLADDLAAHQGVWVEPISTRFGEVDVHELPPNGQGIATLVALNQLDRATLAGLDADGADALHFQIEAMKTGLEQAYEHVADPDHMRERVESMLAVRRPVDAMARAMPEMPRRGGTVYLAAADASGMMVSFIQSNFWGFGSGIVVPGTGIALQNRGMGFNTAAGHPNCVGPGKRPFHTIIPGFVTREGAGLCALGVMGGAMQAQGHLQMITRMFAHGQNPQQALEAPRWRVLDGANVMLEPGLPDLTVSELQRRGHVFQRAHESEFGGGQIILRHRDAYLAGSDPRKDGSAVGY